MGAFRFDRLLAGSALVLVLVAAVPIRAETENGAANAVNEGGVPVATPAEAAPDAGSPRSDSAPAAIAPAPTGAAETRSLADAPQSEQSKAGETRQAQDAPANDAPIQPNEAPIQAPIQKAEDAPPKAAPVERTVDAPAKDAPTRQAGEPPAVDQRVQQAGEERAKDREPETGQTRQADAPAKDEPEQTSSLPVVSIDQQVADKLRELLGAKTDRYFDRKIRAGVEAFYSARDFAPLWAEDGRENERARAAIAQLAAADADGLDPADYPTPDFKAANGPEALAHSELRLTASVLAYVRHAAIGRVHYSRVSSDILYNQQAPDPADALGKLAAASDVRAALDAYHPQHKSYKALKGKLADIRARRAEGGAVRIGSGPTLKIGMRDARAPQLRERLGVPGDGGDLTYDKPLADAVKAFQRQRGIAASGNLTAATVDALNGPRRERDADIILSNMERWRWVPHELGDAHVVVNIPDFSLKVVNNGATVWTTRIVVGKPATPTPLLTETMKYITVNPTWNVPPSIVYNEYLPVLQQDPDALARIGLKVVQNRDGSLHIYQPPGERNALGQIRFNFPNKFLVYQHDTPDKQLFNHDRRAYSHGCMRVQNPDKYAEVLFSIALPNENYTAERVRRMFGGAEQNIQFRTHIPVHLTYQTAFVDDAGKLVIRDDIYGRDARVLAALKGDERRFADIAVERREQASPRRQVRLPERMQSPASFFPFNLFRVY